MYIELNMRSVARLLGWAFVAFFWSVIIFGILGLLNSSDTTGAGMVIDLGLMFMGMTFPLLIIPVSILVYGVRKDTGPFWKVLIKWGTIAAVVYIACLVVTFAFFH